MWLFIMVEGRWNDQQRYERAIRTCRVVACQFGAQSQAGSVFAFCGGYNAASQNQERLGVFNGCIGLREGESAPSLLPDSSGLRLKNCLLFNPSEDRYDKSSMAFMVEGHQ